MIGTIHSRVFCLSPQRFHIACVDVSANVLDTLKEYRCPNCSIKKDERNARLERRTEQIYTDEMTSKTDKAGRKSFGSVTPGKKTKMDNKFPAYKDETDPARKTVVDGFVHVLGTFWEQHSVHRIYGNTSDLAAAIEREMFRQLAEPTPDIHSGEVSRCGNPYKAKYRTLQFNLKDPKNQSLRDAIFSGSVTPQRLVNMTPQEMANEEVARVIRVVREQSITKVMLEEEGDATLVKKTHKGEDYVKPEDLGDAAIDSYLTSKSIPISPAESAPVVDGEDDENWSDEWFGKIYIPDFEIKRLACFAKFLAFSGNRPVATKHLKKILPHNMHCSGRIAMKSASDYTNQVWSGSSSRDVILFQLTSSSTDEMGKLVLHLSEHNRWAVVAHDPTRGIRDFYLAPLSSDQDRSLLPNVAQIDNIIGLALIGVLIISKDGKNSSAVIGNQTYTNDLYVPEERNS